MEKPKLLSSIIGNPSVIAFVKQWAQGWNEGKKQKPLLICGPPGVGKTYLAHALASDFGWSLLELNASDMRDEESVSRLLFPASSASTLFGSCRLILIDDVDSISGKEDKGGITAIARLIQNTSQPIILTALSAYDKKLSTIRSNCTVLEMKRVPISSILSLLKKLSANLPEPLSQQHLEKIAQASNGDVRAALNDLHGRNPNAFRDYEKNIFEVIRSILKSPSYSEARKAALSSEAEHDALKIWLAHNIPFEYEKPFEIAEAFQFLSRADVFDGRILRQQYWGYLRYSSDLASSGVAISKLSTYKKYQNISYPDYIRQMGATKSSRALRNSIRKKISTVCHCSLSQSDSYLQLLSHAAEKHSANLAKYFKLEEEELAFLHLLKKK
ncbi:MAG: replication factor C large subunit [Candidatus Anstonellaceae archaeon]